jgi:hypothetical protein
MEEGREMINERKVKVRVNVDSKSKPYWVTLGYAREKS